MGNSVGMLVGVVCFVCGLIVVILGAVQPTLLIEVEEWTLINVLDDDTGLWTNENGDLKIDSAEDYEVGETREFKAGGNLGIIAIIAFVGALFMTTGLMFFVAHSRMSR